MLKMYYVYRRYDKYNGEFAVSQTDKQALKRVNFEPVKSDLRPKGVSWDDPEWRPKTQKTTFRIKCDDKYLRGLSFGDVISWDEIRKRGICTEKLEARLNEI